MYQVPLATTGQEAQAVTKKPPPPPDDEPEPFADGEIDLENVLRLTRSLVAALDEIAIMMKTSAI